MRAMNLKRRARPRSVAAGLLVFVGLILARGPVPLAQSFSSGSDESDGALTIAPNQGTIIFDPTDVARWGRVLDADGDGVYNFTTVTIGAGTTLQIRGDKVNRPVYWLASGAVTINGTLDLSGSGGINTTDFNARRQVAIPGAGGYPGGAAGIGTSAPPTAGEGPGAGVGTNSCGFPAFASANGGTFTGNRYLFPLVGGSGGAGIGSLGGGGGGGAIIIASSTTITSNPTSSGLISARGGNGAPSNFPSGGGGSGGAIRLVAPQIAGPAQLDVRGGGGSCPGSVGGAGLVRLEGFTISSSISFPAGSTAVTTGTPIPGTLKPKSSIRITAIDDKPVPPNPTGSLQLPDVTISNGQAVVVTIEATGIPQGTVVTLQVYPQSPSDQTVIYLPTAQTTLSGTSQLSTGTATFTFPYGFSRGYVRATWTQ